MDKDKDTGSSIFSGSRNNVTSEELGKLNLEEDVIAKTVEAFEES